LKTKIIRLLSQCLVLLLCSISLVWANRELVETGQCRYNNKKYLEKVPEEIFSWDLYDDGTKDFMVSEDNSSKIQAKKSTYYIKYSGNTMNLFKAESVTGTIRKPRQKYDSGICNIINPDWTFAYKSTINSNTQIWEATTWEKFGFTSKPVSIELECTLNHSPSREVTIKSVKMHVREEACSEIEQKN
jgi:hypothetical protein